MTDDLKERLRPPGRSVVSKCDDVDGKDLSNAPLTYERIWLQAGDAEVTWCQHSQDDEDVPYVRADFYAASLARITDLEARLAAAEAGEDALAAALMGLRSIVEGIDGAMNHGTWRDENSLRLKDTSAWIAAYLALAAHDARRKG